MWKVGFAALKGLKRCFLRQGFGGQGIVKSGNRTDPGYDVTGYGKVGRTTDDTDITDRSLDWRLTQTPYNLMRDWARRICKPPELPTPFLSALSARSVVIILTSSSQSLPDQIEP
jgi:hypothetical protein